MSGIVGCVVQLACSFLKVRFFVSITVDKDPRDHMSYRHEPQK